MYQDQQQQLIPTNEQSIEAILGDWETTDPTRLIYRSLVKRRLLSLVEQVEILKEEVRQEYGESALLQLHRRTTK